tara:strand:+ start:1198 stop:2364 length:1167 start_codon:yes stop_codon:yes gene_type:complete
MFYKQILDFDFSKLDYFLISLFALLSLIGLLVLTTASVHFSDSLYGNPTHILNKQLFHLFLGFFLLITIFLIPLTFWEQFDRWLLALGILLLILVFIPGVGVEVNGANRWIRIFGFSLQPSEIMKFLIILYISAYCVRRSDEVRSDLLSFVRPSVLLVSIISLILIQPDLGTSAVIFASALGVLFVAGVPNRQFFVVFLIGLLGIALLIAYVPWRWERIISFVDPWSDPFNKGYQLTLSLMSIGRGDWFGVGLGESLMKMGYLPDAHTDFIFSILIEELGLLAGILIISMLFGISFRVFLIGRQSLQRRNYFGFFFCFGAAILIGLHVFINVGVATGLLPTKGLTLPLFSAGGTNLLIMCSIIGLILRIDYENKISMPIPRVKKRVNF